MPRRMIISLAAVVAPIQPSTSDRAAAAGTLRVAQREVSQILHAAILSRNRIRAGKRIQALFQRQNASRNNPYEMHPVPTMPIGIPPDAENIPRPPSIDTSPSVPNLQYLNIQFAATRAAIPAIAAASARSHTAMETENVTARSTLPEPSSLEEHITNLSHLVWGVDDLWPMQLKTLRALYEHERAAVFDRTGGGKSHNIRLLGTLFGGVHLVFHPILALTADQLTQFQSGSDKYGSIIAINLDEIGTTAGVKRKIIAFLTTLKRNTSTTIFIFSSPQFMANNPSIMNSLLNNCARKGTLRSITIDEAHLWAKHGSSFCEEIRYLQHNFFAPLYAGTNSGPIFLALTATMSKQTLATLSSLVAIGFLLEKRVWADAEAFAQRNIDMHHQVSSDYTKTLDCVVDYCRDHPSGGAFVFVNTKSLSTRMLPLLEGKLGEKNVAVDVIHVHGSLAKDEKLNLIKLLMGTMTVLDFNPNILLATSAADLGINHPNVGLVLICEWPEDIATYVQRRGRSGRAGQYARVILVAGLSAYRSLIWRIYSQGDYPDEDIDADVDAIIAGVNTIVTPRKSTRNNNQRKKQYPLSSSQRKNLVNHGLAEFSDMLKVCCLIDGCQHARIQKYLATGYLANMSNSTIQPCGGMRSYCTGKWQSTFLPVDRDAVVLWFNSGRVRDEFPMNATADNLFKLLWKRKHWTTAIFDRGFSMVLKSNVEAFFLQMIAAGFIAAERKNGNLLWVVCRERLNEYTDRLVYQNDSKWHGIHLHPTSRIRKYPMTI